MHCTEGHRGRPDPQGGERTRASRSPYLLGQPWAGTRAKRPSAWRGPGGRPQGSRSRGRPARTARPARNDDPITARRSGRDRPPSPPPPGARGPLVAAGSPSQRRTAAADAQGLGRPQRPRRGNAARGVRDAGPGAAAGGAWRKAASPEEKDWAAAVGGRGKIQGPRLSEAAGRPGASMGTRRVGTEAAPVRTAKPARPRRAAASAAEPGSCGPPWSLRSRARKGQKPGQSQRWSQAATAWTAAGPAQIPGAGKGRRGRGPLGPASIPGGTPTRVCWRPDLDGAPEQLWLPGPSRAARGLLGTPGRPRTRATTGRSGAPSLKQCRPRRPELRATRSERRRGGCQRRQGRA